MWSTLARTAHNNAQQVLLSMPGLHPTAMDACGTMSRTRCVSLKKASLHWPLKLCAEPGAGAMRSIMQNQYRWRSQATSSQQRHARGRGACDSAMNANCFEKGMIHLHGIRRRSRHVSTWTAQLPME